MYLVTGALRSNLSSSHNFNAAIPVNVLEMDAK